MKKTFELIEAYDKYIQLLSDECSDLSSMAMVHGWQSTRHKDGNRLREEISLLKMKILTQSAPITPKPTTMKNKEELKTKVFESLGTASMCWKETPTGIFDGTLAVKIGNELWAEIESFIAPSAPITHEPASSGQSAEDVLKGMYGNNTQYGYSFNSTIEAMRLHAAQVCADKDREIDARVEHWDKYYKSCLSMCSRLTDENKHLKSELDRLNDSLTVAIQALSDKSVTEPSEGGKDEKAAKNKVFYSALKHTSDLPINNMKLFKELAFEMMESFSTLRTAQLQSELDRLNESLTVMLNKNAELEEQNKKYWFMIEHGLGVEDMTPPTHPHP